MGAMVESSREVCGSMRVEGGNTKTVWWNDQVKGAIKRKEDAWEEVLGARDEVAKERSLEVYKEKKKC